MSERAGKVEPQGQGKPPPLLPKPTLNVRATLGAARPTSEGLDVERLARALKQADDTQGLNGYREWAERIAREYTALHSEDEPVLCPECGGQYSDLAGHRFHAHGVAPKRPIEPHPDLIVKG